MIKVLHVLGYMPVGGVGTLLLGLNNNIDKNNIHMDCLLFKSDRKSNFSKEWKKSGGGIEIIPFELKPKNYFKIKKFLNTFFEENNYDIVHLHSPNLGFMIFPIVKKYKIGIRILHSHHVVHSENKLRNLRNSVLVRIGNKHSNNYIACSQDAGEFLFSGKPFLFLPNGIEVEKFLYSVEQRESVRNSIDNEVKIIGLIGNLTPIKNQELIIRIAPKLLDLNKNLQFWFIGEGEDREKLEDLVRKNDLENNVFFLGRRNDISALLQAMDVFVMPSEYEGFGISALEAQAAGLPCILSDSIPQEICVIDKVKFVSLRNEDLWIQQILHSMSLEYSRFEIGKQVEESIYSIKNSSEILTQFYMRLMEEI